MSLAIVQYNNPILRKKGSRITVFDAELARFSRAMVAAMHEAEGIGLAAQQVGRAIQLCVVDLRESEAEFHWELDGGRPPRELFMPFVMANPDLTVASGTPEDVYEEGCLSFSQIRGEVKRPVALTARFQDEKGTPHLLTCDGLLARCILHEADHLNGILFIDRMEKKVRAGIDEALRALAKQTRAEAGTSAA
jgi:peptide deformylase